MTIDVSGGFATWSIDGTPLAKVDLSAVSLGGGNIFFGHSETNAGAATDANRAALNVTLIDNISVAEVPEPASLIWGQSVWSACSPFGVAPLSGKMPRRATS